MNDDQPAGTMMTRATLRKAFGRLPPCCQQLITLLIADPPIPPAQIASRLGISEHDVNAHRRRCLDKLRHDPAVAALMTATSSPVC